MPRQPILSLDQAAVRFAQRGGLERFTQLPLTTADAVAVAVILSPTETRHSWQSFLRGWHRRRGVETDHLRPGLVNAGTRWLAQYGVRPGWVVPAVEAVRLLAEWDLKAPRRHASPADPFGHLEWWVDDRRRYVVSIDFLAGGAARIGSRDCARNCVNADHRRTTTPHT